MAVSRYEDIISLPHYRSATRPHMPSADRAAQFAPFAALTGYDQAVLEAARLTQERVSLDETEQQRLDEKLRLLQAARESHPTVRVAFFDPDNRKAGGIYRLLSGRLKGIDELEQMLVLMDGQAIPLEDITELDSPIFPGPEGHPTLG